MEMRVDHAGHERASLAVQPIIDVRRSLVPAMENRLHPAAIVDEQGLESIDLAVFVEPNSLDIVDELIGESRGGRDQRGGGTHGQGEGLHAGRVRRKRGRGKAIRAIAPARPRS